MTDAGSEPVREWLKSLPAIERKVIGEDIKAVQLGCWPLGMLLVRNLGDGIWEGRIELENRVVRVLFHWISPPWCCFTALSRSNKPRPSRTWIWLKTARSN